jgi:hypothetical protein
MRMDDHGRRLILYGFAGNNFNLFSFIEYELSTVFYLYVSDSMGSNGRYSIKSCNHFG